jgi:hypothetical protein
LRVVDAVAQPIVNHELQPSRQQNIDRLCRNELAAREQFPADHTWIRFIQIGRLLAEGLWQRRIAPEPRIGHAHPSFR